MRENQRGANFNGNKVFVFSLGNNTSKLPNSISMAAYRSNNLLSFTDLLLKSMHIYALAYSVQDCFVDDYFTD